MWLHYYLLHVRVRWVLVCASILWHCRLLPGLRRRIHETRLLTQHKQEIAPWYFSWGLGLWCSCMSICRATCLTLMNHKAHDHGVHRYDYSKLASHLVLWLRKRKRTSCVILGSGQVITFMSQVWSRLESFFFSARKSYNARIPRKNLVKVSVTRVIPRVKMYLQ